MPGRHVRFAETPQVHSPPSPLWSLPSPSSGGSHHSRSQPLPHYYRPPPSHNPCVHDVLSVRYPSPVDYDIRLHPSAMPAYDRRGTEPATSPPTSALTLICPGMPQWVIRVQPVNNRSYVTVSDVFEAMYYSLRTNVSSSEFNSIGESDKRRVCRAYEDRYRLARDRAREKAGGVRRVDFLGSRTFFTGLSSINPASGVWMINTVS